MHGHTHERFVRGPAKNRAQNNQSDWAHVLPPAADVWIVLVIVLASLHSIEKGFLEGPAPRHTQTHTHIEMGHVEEGGLLLRR